MCHPICENPAQLTDRRFAEAHTSKTTFDAAGPANQSFLFKNRREDLRCVTVGRTSRQMDEFVAKIVPYHVSPCLDGLRIRRPNDQVHRAGGPTPVNIWKPKREPYPVLRVVSHQRRHKNANPLPIFLLLFAVISFVIKLVQCHGSYHLLYFPM